MQSRDFVSVSMAMLVRTDSGGAFGSGLVSRPEPAFLHCSLAHSCVVADHKEKHSGFIKFAKAPATEVKKNDPKRIGFDLNETGDIFMANSRFRVRKFIGAGLIICSGLGRESVPPSAQCTPTHLAMGETIDAGCRMRCRR